MSEQLERAIKQLKHHVDLMHSQNIQKFTAIRAKREKVIEYLAGVVEEVDARLTAIEAHIGMVPEAEEETETTEENNDT